MTNYPHWLIFYEEVIKVILNARRNIESETATSFTYDK